jgi:hypothetical protein
MKIGILGFSIACMAMGVALADDLGGAPFELPREVVSAATAFEGYMKSAAAIDGGFSGDQEVARSLKAAVSYEPSQLEEGMIGYGAIAALQDDRFVAGVQAAAGRGEARQAFAERLIEDPYAATHIDGAANAARRIEQALMAKSDPLVSAATQVKSAAYSVQHQAWSKVMVADAQGRLAQVKSLSASRILPSEADNQAMMEALAGLDTRTVSDDAPAGFSAIEAKALALAAESVLGRAGGAERDRLSPLFTETSSAQCLRMAKLNLYQCMAVAGPQYEDIFCMGQHAMLDTGKCVAEAANGGATSSLASLSPRPEGQSSYTPLVAHHALRVEAN